VHDEERSAMRPTQATNEKAVESALPSRNDDPCDLDEFHGGKKSALTNVYRDHVAALDRAVGQMLPPADKETVVHEVFFRLFTNAELRLRFRGGSMRAWLLALARDLALEQLKRSAREQFTNCDPDGAGGSEPAADIRDAVEARSLVDSFRRDHLPPEWAGVFELRFLQQLDPNQAARLLGIRSTTLTYREYRIRRRLRRFLLRA
jgi:RNA polymerase sigma-70 factor (ECF subfamily)